MTTPSKAETTISNLLDKSRSLTVDGVTKTNIAIQDAIAADKHLAKKTAATSSRMGLRMGVFRAPGHY